MPKALKKIFSWVILELAGREWCTVPPPQGGNRHLVTVPPGVGGNRRPLGGDGHGGGEGTKHMRCSLCNNAQPWLHNI